MEQHRPHGDGFADMQSAKVTGSQKVATMFEKASNIRQCVARLGSLVNTERRFWGSVKVKCSLGGNGCGRNVRSMRCQWMEAAGKE